MVVEESESVNKVRASLSTRNYLGVAKLNFPRDQMLAGKRMRKCQQGGQHQREEYGKSIDTFALATAAQKYLLGNMPLRIGLDELD